MPFPLSFRVPLILIFIRLSMSRSDLLLLPCIWKIKKEDIASNLNDKDVLCQGFAKIVQFRCLLTYVFSHLPYSIKQLSVLFKFVGKKYKQSIMTSLTYKQTMFSLTLLYTTTSVLIKFISKMYQQTGPINRHFIHIYSLISCFGHTFFLPFGLSTSSVF